MTKKMMTILTMATVMFFATTLLASGKNFNKSMHPILSEYLKIHSSLAKDKTDGVVVSAKKIGKLAGSLDPKAVHKEHAGHYKHITMNLKKASKKMAVAKSATEMREALKDLSKPMAMWASMAKPKGIKVAYCPMVKASWLQKGDMILNPYDMRMPKCGNIVGGDMTKGGHEKKDGHGHM